MAVNDADAGQAGEEGAVEILLQFFGGFIDGAADEVDLHAHVVGVGAGDGDVDAFLSACGGQRVRHCVTPRVSRPEDLGEIVALDAHLDGAESYFEEILFNFALDNGDFVHGLDANLIAGCYVTQQMRLGVDIILVGTGAMGDDGLVEALLKFAAKPVDAAFGFFGKLLLCGAIFDGAHVLAHLEFELLDQRGELGFQFAGTVAQLDVTFAGEFGAFKVQRVLLFASGLLFGFKLREFVVEAIEEAGDIDLLRAKAFAGGRDDVVRLRPRRAAVCIPAEAPGTPRRSW